MESIKLEIWLPINRKKRKKRKKKKKKKKIDEVVAGRLPSELPLVLRGPRATPQNHSPLCNNSLASGLL